MAIFATLKILKFSSFIALKLSSIRVLTSFSDSIFLNHISLRRPAFLRLSLCTPFGMVNGTSFKRTVTTLFALPLHQGLAAFFLRCCSLTTHSLTGSNFIFFTLLWDLQDGNNSAITLTFTWDGLLSLEHKFIALEVDFATYKVNSVCIHQVKYQHQQYWMITTTIVSLIVSLTWPDTVYTVFRLYYK